jgi:UPF0176 protein
MYEILLYYKYTNIAEPEALKATQEELCKNLNLKGRIIIAKEGINGTVEGLQEHTQKYIDELVKDSRFSDIHFKRSVGTGKAFPKLSIKVRSEIVSAHLGADDFSPAEITGKYMSPEELHELLKSDKEFYLIDMRNDYEFKVGYFENSILAPFSNFRDLPKILPQIEHLKDKTIVTVCTGGVRCEKASGFLVKHGFKDVYQLYGGIVSYMEKYPNQDFKGKLYVFDDRVVMGFNTTAPEHEIVGKCEKCGATSDNYLDCAYIHCKGHRHFICCENCLEKDGKAYCTDECKKKAVVVG